MKFITNSRKNCMEFRAMQPKKFAKAESRYLAKAETIRRNNVRKEKRGEW